MKWLSHKKQALNRDRAPAQAPVWRSRVVLGVLAVAFLILAGRAAWLQMWNEQFLKDRAEKLSSSKIEIPATRGRILDRNGEILAVSSPMKAIWIAPEIGRAHV